MTFEEMQFKLKVKDSGVINVEQENKVTDLEIALNNWKCGSFI